MLKTTRAVFAALTILLASATAFIAVPNPAVARGGAHDHKEHKQHKDHADRKDHGDRRSDHERSEHRRKHKKQKVVCIKAPCPGDSGARDGRRRRKQADVEGKDKARAGNASAKGKDEGCGKVIVPTAGCGTPANDPVGNTRPSLPQRTDTNRKPVLEDVRKSQPLSENVPAKPAPMAGKLQSDGNTHPTAAVNPPAAVTVSNGVTTTQIQNGLGGLTAYSDKPGTITVTNGREKTTLTGASVTLSGNVVGVGGGQGVQVGPRNGEGKTVVATKPAQPPAVPRNGEDDARAFMEGCTPCEIMQGVHDFGYGISHGFAPGPAPEPKTSTTTQQ
jgi:hypothetical protein